MKINKAAGHDKIPAKILKGLAAIISGYLTKLINLSFEKGAFPEKWKIGKVVPAYKEGEKHNPDNYRPLTVLASLSVICERVANKDISQYLEQAKVLFSTQAAFRPGHSTTTAIFNLHENILSNLEKGKYVVVVFIDLSKAFDTVQHSILLDAIKALVEKRWIG